MPPITNRGIRHFAEMSRTKDKAQKNGALPKEKVPEKPSQEPIKKSMEKSDGVKLGALPKSDSMKKPLEPKVVKNKRKLVESSDESDYESDLKSPLFVPRKSSARPEPTPKKFRVEIPSSVVAPKNISTSWSAADAFARPKSTDENLKKGPEYAPKAKKTIDNIAPLKEPTKKAVVDKVYISESESESELEATLEAESESSSASESIISDSQDYDSDFGVYVKKPTKKPTPSVESATTRSPTSKAEKAEKKRLKRQNARPQVIDRPELLDPTRIAHKAFNTEEYAKNPNIFFPLSLSAPSTKTKKSKSKSKSKPDSKSTTTKPKSDSKSDTPIPTPTSLPTPTKLSRKDTIKLNSALRKLDKRYHAECKAMIMDLAEHKEVFVRMEEEQGLKKKRFEEFVERFGGKGKGDDGEGGKKKIGKGRRE